MTRPPPIVETPSTPQWVCTFADMVSLLCTFFILLMTYSTQEKETYAKLRGALLGGFGIIADPKVPDRDGITPPTPTLQNRVPIEGLRSSRQDLERFAENARSLVRKPGVGNMIDWERTRDGLRIRIGAEASFRAGDAALTPPMRTALREVADLLRLHTNRVVVIGHAWDEGAGDDDAAAEVLSGSRARTAAEYLRETGRVGERRISICGRGAREPVEDRHDLAAARANRRLEVLVVQD